MALIVREVSKAFDGQPALQGINLVLDPGVIAVLGPNGAGKSTLLRLLATLLRPDAGDLQFAGRLYRADLRALRAALGYLPADLELPPTMTPRGLLAHLALLKLLPGDAHAPALLDTLGLAPLAATPLNRRSGGEVRRAAVAQAFLGTPRLLVLDEPTRGLDIQERERVFRLMRQPVPGRTVVFSTHLPDEAALIANQVVILRQGRVLYAGQLENLMEMEAACQTIAVRDRPSRRWKRPTCPSSTEPDSRRLEPPPCMVGIDNTMITRRPDEAFGRHRPNRRLGCGWRLSRPQACIMIINGQDRGRDARMIQEAIKAR